VNPCSRCRRESYAPAPQRQGPFQRPRMGSFIALYGIDNSRKLIAEALESVAS
jgi:hypothetical protein